MAAGKDEKQRDRVQQDRAGGRPASGAEARGWRRHGKIAAAPLARAGTSAYSQVNAGVVRRGGVMSSSGLRWVSLVLLLALTVYVALDGGA